MRIGVDNLNGPFQYLIWNNNLELYFAGVIDCTFGYLMLGIDSAAATDTFTSDTVIPGKSEICFNAWITASTAPGWMMALISFIRAPLRSQLLAVRETAIGKWWAESAA